MYRVTIGLLTVLVLCVGAVWGAEELRITFPDSLVQQFNYGGKAGVIFERPSLFGIPNYRTSISGLLVLSPNLLACTPLPSNATALPGIPSVLYVDRGTCSYTTKVRNAGNAGYQSVIVGDDRVESSLPYMADDGSTPPVTTPAVMISLADAQKLKTALTSQPPVTVSITYQLPNPDNRVEWDLWTLSIDSASAAFKHTFGSVVKAFGNSTLLTPRMYTVNGHTLGCDVRNRCGNQCSNGGLYCALDPERDPTTGISGRDVIQENVRQLCLFQLLLNRSNTAQYLWFDYVTKFDSLCQAPCSGSGTYDPYSTTDPNCSNGFSANCSYAVMRSLNFSTALVEQCVAASGGTKATDGRNTLLEKQLSKLIEQGVFYMPTVIINNAKYTGAMSCGSPPNFNNCGPLNAICSGFAKATEPQVCVSLDQGCDIGKLKDLCGVCGGDSSSCMGCDGVPNSGKVKDLCGVCEGNSTSCLGCDGVPNSGKVKDLCGVCGGDSSSCKGCDGVPNSGKVFDKCGVCGGDSTLCMGCDGVPNSGKVRDLCGVCDGNSTSCMGCDGVPNSGRVKDKCEVCGGDSTSCMGCDAVPNSGKRLDLCGVCGGNSTLCMGCDGVPNSKIERDSCGVCGGSGTRLGSCLSLGALSSIIVCSVLVVAIIIFGVWFYFRRQSRLMRDDLDSVLKQYLPMDNDGGINTTKGRVSTADHERLVDNDDV